MGRGCQRQIPERDIRMDGVGQWMLSSDARTQAGDRLKEARLGEDTDEVPGQDRVRPPRDSPNKAGCGRKVAHLTPEPKGRGSVQADARALEGSCVVVCSAAVAGTRDLGVEEV